MADPVEALRTKLRGMRYQRVSDTELNRMMVVDAESRHNDLLEGIEEDPGVGRLFAMLREERVPLCLQREVVEAYFDRISRDGGR